MRFNQGSKFVNILKSIQNIPNASGHSRSLLTSCRTRPSWHNGSPSYCTKWKYYACGAPLKMNYKNFPWRICKQKTVKPVRSPLTHWGRATHICFSKLTIIGSDNGFSPGRRQAIIWTNAGILLIWPSRTNLSEISIDIQTFSFKKIHFKMLSGKWRPFCLGLNVLNATKTRSLIINHHFKQLWYSLRITFNGTDRWSLCWYSDIRTSGRFY